jgi:uncharacterized protein (UPF0303 family)
METTKLKTYIADLEQNLKINKELLQNVLMGAGLEEPQNVGIKKLQAEVERLGKSKYQLLQMMQETEKSKEEMHELLKDKEK